MIKMAIRLLLYGLIALLMPLLVHAEEIETKEETKIVEKESILENTKSVNPDDPTESCSNMIKENELNILGYFNSSGNISISANNPWYHSDYLRVKANETYVITKNYSNSTEYCLYDLNKNLIGNCVGSTQNVKYITPTQDGYIRFDGIVKSENINKIEGNFCVNMEEETMIATKSIEKLLIIGVGILIAIFLTRRN